MLRQFEDQPDALSWLVPWGKFFKDVDNSGQLVPTFLSKYRRKHKKSRVLFILEYFILFTALMCFHSIFNLLKRVTDGNFVFLCKMWVFLFIHLSNLDAQIRYHQNRYTNLKSPISFRLATAFLHIFYLEFSLHYNKSLGKTNYSIFILFFYRPFFSTH